MGMSRSQGAGAALMTAQAVMTPIWSAPEVSGSGVRGYGRIFPCWTCAFRTSPCSIVPHRPGSLQPAANTLSQVVNKERTSLAADMWSFGMLVWELATGLDITAFPPLSVTVQVGMGGVEVWELEFTAFLLFLTMAVSMGM